MEPFVALITDGRLVRYIREREYYEPLAPQKTFPGNAIKRILSDEEIDSVVFLGKPFLYMENMILIHCCLFPRSFSTFKRDISDYFKKILAIPGFIYETQKDARPPATELCRYPVYYIRTDDALAHNAEADIKALIITCLTDIFEGSSFCCFEKKAGNLKLVKETNILNSFSNLLKIYNETKQQVDLGQIVETSEKKLFRFKKRYCTIRGNSFAIESRYLSPDDNFEKPNDQLMLNIFSELMLPFEKEYRQIVFITDCPVPSNIVGTHTNIIFTQVDQHHKLVSTCKYFFQKIDKMNLISWLTQPREKEQRLSL